jgi:integrase
MAKIKNRSGWLYIDYYDNAGKRQRRTLHLKASRENLKKAEIEQKKIEFELATGIHKQVLKRDRVKNITLKEGFEEFKKFKKDRKENTLEHYKFALDKIISIVGNKPINSVNSIMIENIEKQLSSELSKNSIASYFGELKHMFDYFKDKEYVKNNPIPTRKIKPKKIITVPEKEMLDILQRLQETNRKHYQVIFFLLATGLRRSELVNLFWRDIDLKKNLIAIRNAKDDDRIDYLPIYDELRNFILKEFPVREGKIFDYKRGDSLKFFSRFLEREKFNHYSLHTLRKTYISRLVNSGLSVYYVMALARHRKIETTLKHYTNLELEKMGKEISERANMGTLLGTKINKPLKLIKTSQKQW